MFSVKKLAAIAAVALSAIAFAPNADAATGCVPSVRQVALFQGTNYTGNCVIHNVGQDANSAAIGLPDNTISSVKVGAHVKLTLYRNTNFQGVASTFYSNDPDLANNTINTNDASSMKVEYRTCSPSSLQVALYTGANFTGECVVKGVGEYENATEITLPSNSISSIKVGSKVRARLYRDNNFAGVSQLFTANEDDLDDTTIGSNTTQSVKVEHEPCYPGAMEIALYQGANLTGQCVIKGVGSYDNAAEIGLPDNTVSSIKVGASVKATLYRDANFGGANSSFTANDSDLSNDAIGSNTTSSVKVTCDPSANQVALFQGINYTGACVVKGVGNYSNAAALGLADNTISSVKLGANVKIRLYRDANFAGISSLLSASEDNLADVAVDENTASSAKVELK